MKYRSPLGSDWFKRDVIDNVRFWSRFGGRPPLEGSSVLDVGCCRGTLCIDMAMAGASHVIGIDIELDYVNYARATLQKHYPSLVEKIRFDVGRLAQYQDDSFDYIVSKDVFEHVQDLAGLLKDIKRCLKPGGRLYVGYGPLYYAPDGAHGLFGPFPWGHLLFPDRVLLALANYGRIPKLTGLHQLTDLNKLPFSKHRMLLHEAGLKVVYFKYNQSKHFLSKVLSLLRNIPCLDDICTHNIYCILEK